MSQQARAIPLLGLRPDERATIRELQRIRPVWNMVAPLHLAVPVLCGFAAAAWPTWPVVAPCVLLSGFSLHACALLMHEALHGNVFRRPRWDRFAAFVLAAPVALSGTAYGVIHGPHHRYTRSDRDPDEILRFVKSRALHTLGFVIWMLVGSIWYLAVIPGRALRLATPALRRRILFEYAAIAAAFGSALALCWVHGALWGFALYWGLPFLIATWIGNGRAWAEHQMTEPDHPLRNTRSVVTHPVFAFLLCNSNLHLEHHLFPAVPWYNLPRLHALLAPHYRGMVRVRRSYLHYLWEAACARGCGTLP